MAGGGTRKRDPAVSGRRLRITTDLVRRGGRSDSRLMWRRRLARHDGKGPGKAKLCDHAVIESRDRADLVSGKSDHQ